MWENWLWSSGKRIGLFLLRYETFKITTAISPFGHKSPQLFQLSKNTNWIPKEVSAAYSSNLHTKYCSIVNLTRKDPKFNNCENMKDKECKMVKTTWYDCFQIHMNWTQHQKISKKKRTEKKHDYFQQYRKQSINYLWIFLILYNQQNEI